jgi:AraC family transcriptional regulator
MILFIPPGMALNGSWGAGRQRSLSCLIDAGNFGDGLADLGDRALVECLNVRDHDIMYGLQRLARETAQPSFVSPVLREALLVTLSADLLRHLSILDRREAGASGLAPWRMRLIEDRIRSPEPLPKVSELAALCRMSTRHLARAFKNETGATLRQRIKAAGLARAQQMLAEGHAPIKQIAGQLGFASTSSFSSAFLRATGNRPKDTRARGGDGAPRPS